MRTRHWAESEGNREYSPPLRESRGTSSNRKTIKSCSVAHTTGSLQEDQAQRARKWVYQTAGAGMRAGPGAGW